MCMTFLPLVVSFYLSFAKGQTSTASFSHTTTKYTTQCFTELPTAVTTYTAPVTVPTNPGASAGPVIGQPWIDEGSISQEHDGPLSLQVSTTGKNTSSPSLYGIILEDLDHSIDGGLYAEAIQNRAFQNETLEAWYPIGGACISLNYDDPLSAALPADLSIDLESAGYGFGNIGWWGFSVRPVAYRASFWARTTSSTSFKVKAALLSATDRTEWSSSNITINSTTWTYYETNMVSSQAAPNSNNVLEITSLDENGDTLHFNLISLFPPTYNNRSNGVRPDLMQNLLDLDLKYCRVPGGNNLEGQTPSTRWKWNETIGPLQDRPGRPGDWGYYNTDGMGLLEWLKFCDDLGAETLLGIYDGYSLQGTSIVDDQLQPYIDDILNELEYVFGANSTPYGALRARDGHPDPFDVKYIEIGNEDFFSDTYSYRWPAFYKALSAAYPNITFVATTSKGITFPYGVQFDQHFYGDSNDFTGMFNAYDDWPRNNGTPILVGEYSVQRFDNETFSEYPFLEGSVAEAVYSLGLERNSDVIVTQLYAPFLSNLHYNREHKPRLISFDVDPSQTVLSTSYYMLQMLSRSHGSNSSILPVTANIGFHPLYWVASLDEESERVYIKLANAGNSSQQVSIAGESVSLSCSNATILTGDMEARNEPASKDTVVPEPLTLTTIDTGTSLELPGWSVPVVNCSVSA